MKNKLSHLFGEIKPIYKIIGIVTISVLFISGCAVKRPFSSGIISGKVLFFTHTSVIGSKDGINKVCHLNNGDKFYLTKEEEQIVNVDVGDYVIVNFTQPQSMRVTKVNGNITLYQYDNLKNIKVIKVNSIKEKKVEKVEKGESEKKILKKEEPKITAENWR